MVPIFIVDGTHMIVHKKRKLYLHQLPLTNVAKALTPDIYAHHIVEG